MLDLVIIGAGPSGIAASLYAARNRLNFVTLSKDVGGLTNIIPKIDTYLGMHYVSGFDLILKFQDHLKDYKVNLKTEAVKEVKKKGRMFIVKTDKNEYETKVIIIASGRKFKKLHIKGEKEFEGKGLSHCAACDGPLFKGKTVAIIGGGKSGLLATLFMSSIAKKIYLIEIKPHLGGIEHWREAVKKMKNVEIMTNTKTLEILGDKFVNGIKVQQDRKKHALHVEGVFVEIGYEPNTDFVKGFVKLNKRNEIIANKQNETNVKGIFATGDVTDIWEKQVVVAVGEGAKALLSAYVYLKGERP